MPPELIDALKNIGIVGGTVVIVWILSQLAIKLIDFLKLVITGIKESIDKFAAALNTISTNQNAHDSQIAGLQSTTNTALDKLNITLEGYDKVLKAATTGFQHLDEHVVASLNETSEAIGLTATDVKKNSDENATKIITEVQKFRESLENPDGVLRADAKGHADRIIEAFQSLSKRNTELEAEVTSLKLAKQILEATAARLQDKNAGVQADDHDPTEPLTFLMTAQPTPLSPVDGAANREIIDAAQPTPEAGK